METVTVAAIEAGVPTLIEAREIIAEFHLMIRRKTEAGLIPWIERARASLVASLKFFSDKTEDPPPHREGPRFLRGERFQRARRVRSSV